MNASFWKVTFVILLVIVGLGLVVLGLRIYGKYYHERTTENALISSGNVSKLDGNLGTTSTVPFLTPTADDDPAIGADDPTIEIIAFEDFECPFCKEAAPVLRALVEQYPNDIRFVFRDFPLTTIHSQALPTAMAGECANDHGKFWEWHDIVFERQSQLSAAETVFPLWAEELELDVDEFTTCLESEQYRKEVEKDFDQGLLAGVTGTPTYFVNGEKVAGSLSLEQWKNIVEQLLSNGSQD